MSFIIYLLLLVFFFVSLLFLTRFFFLLIIVIVIQQCIEIYSLWILFESYISVAFILEQAEAFFIQQILFFRRVRKNLVNKNKNITFMHNSHGLCYHQKPIRCIYMSMVISWYFFVLFCFLFSSLVLFQMNCVAFIVMQVYLAPFEI